MKAYNLLPPTELKAVLKNVVSRAVREDDLRRRSAGGRKKRELGRTSQHPLPCRRARHPPNIASLPAQTRRSSHIHRHHFDVFVVLFPRSSTRQLAPGPRASAPTWFSAASLTTSTTRPAPIYDAAAASASVCSPRLQTRPPATSYISQKLA